MTKGSDAPAPEASVNTTLIERAFVSRGKSEDRVGQHHVSGHSARATATANAAAVICPDAVLAALCVEHGLEMISTRRPDDRPVQSRRSKAA